MKTIVPNQDFKHGRETYKKGEPYEVEDGEAFYFQQCGWVGDGQSSGDAATLDIQDVTSGHKAEVK